MRRREFIEKAGCGAVGFAAAPLAEAQEESGTSVVMRRYDMDIEVYEVGPQTRCHKKGEKFKWPQDIGKVCHWLASALDPVCTSLNAGATFPWKYPMNLARFPELSRHSMWKWLHRKQKAKTSRPSPYFSMALANQ